MPMFFKGKLNLVPGWGGTGEVKRIFVKKGAGSDADV